MPHLGLNVVLGILLLKAAPGYPDPDVGPMIVMIVGFSVLLLVGWAVGYFTGKTPERRIRGAAVGLAAVALVPAVVDFPWGFAWLPATLTGALWYWGWSALGQAVGKATGHAVAGGIWGALLGPLGVLIAWAAYGHSKHRRHA